MNYDFIAILLGIAGIAILLIFFIWQRRFRRKAGRKLREEFEKEEQRHDG